MRSALFCIQCLYVYVYVYVYVSARYFLVIYIGI